MMMMAAAPRATTTTIAAGGGGTESSSFRGGGGGGGHGEAMGLTHNSINNITSTYNSNNPMVNPRDLHFDLIRLLRFMERDENLLTEGGDDGDAAALQRRQRQHQVNTWRIDHLENLWRQLRNEDKTADLRQRIDRIKGIVGPRAVAASSKINDDDDDPIRRIFFATTTTKPQQSSQELATDAERGAAERADTGASNGGEATSLEGGADDDDDDDDEDAVDDGDDDRNAGPMMAALRPASPVNDGAEKVESASSRRRQSVQELREEQRHQMEEAIATLAAQLKRQTEAIHTTLQHQNKHLGDMEDVATTNVDHVEQLAKDVTAHVRKGWTTTFTTWAILIVVAIAFVMTCLVILMIPKRPGACLLFCPRPQSQPPPPELICHNTADGTKECLTVPEALARLYESKDPNGNLDPPTLQQQHAHEELQREQPKQPREYSDDAHGEEWGNGGGVGDVYSYDDHQRHVDVDVEVGAGSIESETKIHKCQWDGRSGGGDPSSSSSECAASGLAADPSKQDDTAATTTASIDDQGAVTVPTDAHRAPKEKFTPDGASGTTSTDTTSNEVDDVLSAVAVQSDPEDLSHSPLTDESDGGDGSSTMGDADRVEVQQAKQVQEAKQGEDENVDDHANDPIPADDQVHELVDDKSASMEDAAEDIEDEWELPPIPDADDVLREYMENYRQAEAEFRGGDDRLPEGDGDYRADDDADGAWGDAHVEVPDDAGETPGVRSPEEGHRDVDSDPRDDVERDEALQGNEEDFHGAGESLRKVDGDDDSDDGVEGADDDFQDEDEGAEIDSTEDDLGDDEVSDAHDVVERDEALQDSEGDGPTEPVVDPFTPFDVRNAAAVGDVSRLERYLRTRPDWVNDADRNHWTALHLAARAGHVEVVQLLLHFGADPLMETVSGDTAVAIATKRLGPDHPVTALLDDL